jgi:hypothetical protein
MHVLKCGHNSCPVCDVIQMPPYGTCHCVAINFVETQARATTVPCVQCRTQYSEDSDSEHNSL